MAVAAALNVLLTAQTAQFQAGMKKAEAQTKAFQAVTSKASAALGGIKTAFVAVGATAAAHKLSTAFVGTVNAIDDAADAAERLGISFQSMKTFEAISKRSGLDAETLTNAMEKMSVTLGKARDGSTEAQAAFSKLALGGMVAGGAGNESVFLKTIEALNGIEDASARAAAQQAVFGKGAKGLSDILGLTTKQFDAMKSSMVASGQILSDQQLKSVLDSKAAIDKMAEAWDRATTSLAAYVAPTVTARLTEMAALIDGMQGRMTLAQMTMGNEALPPGRAAELNAELEATRRQAPGTTVDNSFKVVNGGMRSRPFQAMEQFRSKTIFASMTAPFEKMAKSISDSAEKAKEINKREFDESVARIRARKQQEAMALASSNAGSGLLGILGLGKHLIDGERARRSAANTIVGGASSISAGSQADALFEHRRRQAAEIAKNNDENKLPPLLQRVVAVLEKIERKTEKPAVFDVGVF